MSVFSFVYIQNNSKKFQAGYLGETWQTDSEVHQEEETTRTNKILKNQDNERGISLFDGKIHCKTITFKTG